MARRKDIEQEVISKYKAPRPDVLLVLHDEIPLQVKLASGVVLPQNLGNKTRVENSGTVISVGEKIKGLKVGDRVLMDKRYGARIPHEYMETSMLVLISEDQVEGLFTGEDAEKDFEMSLDGLEVK